MENIKERNKLQRLYKRNKTEFNKRNLYNLIDHVKEEIIDFRSKQWQKFTLKLGARPLSTKPFWNRINRLKNKK